MACPFDSVDGHHASATEITAWGCGLVRTAAIVGGAVGDAIMPGAGSAASMAVTVVTDAVTNGVAAYDTMKTVAGLKDLLEKTPGMDSGLKVIINYCIKKRTSKGARQIAKAIPLAGAGTTAFQTVKAGYKLARETKGVNRDFYSRWLYKFATGAEGNPQVDQPVANKVIQLICGGAFEQVMKNAIAAGMKSAV
jgi:hypothetical protein